MLQHKIDLWLQQKKIFTDDYYWLKSNDHRPHLIYQVLRLCIAGQKKFLFNPLNSHPKFGGEQIRFDAVDGSMKAVSIVWEVEKSTYADLAEN